MSFIYDREQQAAVDSQRGISLRQAVGAWSDGVPIIAKFTYTSSEVSFSFGAVSHDERRIFTQAGKQIERLVCIAIDVFEPSIDRALRRASSFSLTPEKLQDIKAAIREGMYELAAIKDLNGIRLVPELKVSFVSSIESIPPTPSPSRRKAP
jgi:hypothetical protein